ncbi:MAG: acyltransferase [Burkholderiaceae bacterium]|nr:acyltransferase [Burkholderiaceae bacterium]
MLLDKLLTYERHTSSGTYLEGVTGLRAVAALWVLMFHSWGISHGPPVQIPLPLDAHLGVTYLFSAGGLGVDIFFVISGFLLSLPWIQARPARETLKQIPKFYGRRLLRIIPAYYAVIFFLLYAFLLGMEPYPSTWHVFVQVFMLNGLLDVLNIDSYLMNLVFWTLHAEIAFYVFLPFIALAAHRIGWKTVIIAMIAFSVVFRWWLFDRFHATDFFKMHFLYSMPGCLGQFAIGIACACLFARDKTIQNTTCRMPRRILLPAGWSFWLGIAILLVIARVLDLRGDMLAKGDLFYTISPLISAAGAAAIIIGVIRQSRTAIRALANPVMIFLGTISYSMYVWHLILLGVVNKSGILEPFVGIDRLLRTVIFAFPLILLVSYGSYWWVERPFLKIRHHAPEIRGAFTTKHAIWLLAGCGAAMTALAALTNWALRP